MILKNGGKEQLAQVKAIYAELEKRPVVRDCIRRTECCYFKITGLTPQLTAGEALLAAKAWKATGRKQLKQRDDGGCPMLQGDTGQGKCAIYEGRPFGCRTHFCAQAGGPYARRDVLDLIRKLEEIDHSLGGDGPHAIENAISEALSILR